MGSVTVWRGLLFLLLAAASTANRRQSGFGHASTEKVAMLGQKTRLPCPVKSDPELTKWMKNGQTITIAWDRYKVSTRDGALHIQNTQMEDAGLYSCKGIDGFGSRTVNVTVIVYDEENQVYQEADKLIKKEHDEDLSKRREAPFFDDIERMQQGSEMIKPTGSNLRLLCKVSGNPVPQVRWYKDAQLLMTKKNGTLKIQRAKAKHSGRYTCVAKNRLGQANFTYNVQVIDEIRYKPRLIPPHPMSQTVSVGKTVSFQCLIESVVEPTVRWYKRIDKPEDISNLNASSLVSHKNEKFMALKNAGEMLARPHKPYLNKLVIANVKPQDAGMFVCSATNKRGYSYRHAILTVQGDGNGEINSLSSDSSSQNIASLDPKNPKRTSSDSADSSDKLPLFIGLPFCVIFIIIIIIVFRVQRKNCCQQSSPNNKVPRTAVPTQERGDYYYSNCHQHRMQQTTNPLLNSREKLPKTPTPSLDVTCSEFSSVSRTQPNPHQQYHHNNQMNYGY